MKAPFIKKFFNGIKAFVTGRDNSFRAKVQAKDKEKLVNTHSGGHKNRSKPAWWVKFFGFKSRKEAGLLNKQVIKFFGSFRPIRRFGVTPRMFEARYGMRTSK